jgi:hypothetical protein
MESLNSPSRQHIDRGLPFQARIEEVHEAFEEWPNDEAASSNGGLGLSHA